MEVRKQRIAAALIWGVILGVALFFRSEGLFRGLKTGTIYHPDSPKQVYSFHNYLNGRYLWYDGSLFIDGYPLFLNHFDEWLTRPLYEGYECVARHLYGERQNPYGTANPSGDYYPNAVWLFYWTRILRVFYGLLIVYAAYRLARMAGVRRCFAWLAALLAAVNPLEVATSHAATGDISVALFGAYLYLLLFRFARTGNACYWACAAVFGGFAFSGKYQGLLVSMVPALFLLFYEWACRRKPLRMAGLGMLYLVFLLGGILAAIPQFFIKGRKTLELILANFEFLANYKTPAEILQKPLLERAVLGYQKNLIPLWSAIGFVLTFAALAGLAVAARQWWKARRTGDAASQRAGSLWLALFASPFLCVLISLFGKYNVQPFHFSYLNVPLILSAVFLLDAGWARKTLRPVVLLGVALLVAAPWPVMFREHYFWSREEAFETHKKLADNLLDPCYTDAQDVQRVRFFNMEDESSLPVFRNRIRELTLPNASFWNSLHMAPVPSIPFPDPVYWIFNNGPVYPRNDREFLAPKDDSTEKAVVWSRLPDRIRLGVRSGVWPTRVTLCAGKTTHDVTLPPNTQTLLTVSPDEVSVLITNSATQPDAWMTRLRVDTEIGPAWITVLQDDREEVLFRLFGGQCGQYPVLLDPDISRSDEIAEQVERTRYYDNIGQPWEMLQAGESRPMLSYAPLAAGIFRWRTRLIAETPDAVAVLRGTALFAGNDWTTSAWSVRFPLKQGLNDLEHVFSKTFLPYQYHLDLACERGVFQAGTWTVKPDTRAILNDLKIWRDAGVRPPWALIAPESIAPAPPAPEDPIMFGKAVRLHQIEIPEQSGSRGVVTVFVSMDLLKPIRHLHEKVVFIHFIREGMGGHAGVIGFPVYQALNSETWSLPIQCLMDARLEGVYEMWMGITSCRVDDRLSIRTPSEKEHPVEHRKIYIGKVMFRP